MKESTEVLSEGFADVMKKVGQSIQTAVSKVKRYFFLKKSLRNLQMMDLPQYRNIKGGRLTSLLTSEKTKGLTESSLTSQEWFTEKVAPKDVQKACKKFSKKHNVSIHISNQSTAIGQYLLQAETPAALMVIDKSKLEDFYQGKAEAFPTEMLRENYEKVIIVDPTFLAQFPHLNIEGLYYILEHEYGHYLTYEEITMEDWAQCMVKTAMLNDIAGLCIKTGMNDQEINRMVAEINACRWEIKPEKMANDKMGLKIPDLFKAIFGYDLPVGWEKSAFWKLCTVDLPSDYVEYCMGLAGLNFDTMPPEQAVAIVNKDWKIYQQFLPPKFKKMLAPIIEEKIASYRSAIGDTKKPATESTITEAYDPTEQSGLGPERALTTLGTLAQSIITNKDSKKSINQYTLNTIANLINNNGLLHKWAPTFKSIQLTLTSSPKLDFEFVPPAKTSAAANAFIERFVNGHEHMSDYLKHSPEVHLKISKAWFKKLSERKQLVATLEAAVRYYDKGIDKASQEIMKEVIKSGEVMKRLISESELKQTIFYLMKLVLIFDEIDPQAVKFYPDDEVIKTVNTFIRTVLHSGKANQEERITLLNDMRKAVDAVYQVSTYSELTQNFRSLPVAIHHFSEGYYDEQINQIRSKIIRENTEDVFLEKVFGKKVKRLKKIPPDLVSYILIEGRSIRDDNDRLLIISYLFAKVEIIEWYIELIDVQSPNYIVPHTRDHLVRIKNQLMEAHKEIMAIKLRRPSDPIIQIGGLPPGYEG